MFWPGGVRRILSQMLLVTAANDTLTFIKRNLILPDGELNYSRTHARDVYPVPAYPPSAPYTRLRCSINLILIPSRSDCLAAAQALPPDGSTGLFHDSRCPPSAAREGFLSQCRFY